MSASGGHAHHDVIALKHLIIGYGTARKPHQISISDEAPVYVSGT
jgi:hypothetical protein